MIEDEFGRIDYDEIGQGPTVVWCRDHAAPALHGDPSLHNGRTVFAVSPQVCSGMAVQSNAVPLSMPVLPTRQRFLKR